MVKEMLFVKKRENKRRKRLSNLLKKSRKEKRKLNSMLRNCSERGREKRI